MTKQSNAIVFERAGEIAMRPVTLRAMDAGDVLVETYWSSISAGTEKMLLNGKLPKMQMMNFPVVPGYETVGKVIAAGTDKSLLEKFVYVSGSLGYTDVNAAFGGASQYLVSPAHKVTALTGLEDASVGLALPLAATALHIVDVGMVQSKRVLVLGQGAVGLLACEFARLFGASRIIATDLHASRLRLSCADTKLNLSGESFTDAMKGVEVDVVLECSGSMTALEESLSVLKMRGTVVLGGYYERIDMSYAQPFMKELTFLAAKQWALGDLERVRALMASKAIDFKKIFTHYCSLDEAVDAYYTAFSNPDCVKMVVNWQQD